MPTCTDAPVKINAAVQIRGERKKTQRQQTMMMMVKRARTRAKMMQNTKSFLGYCPKLTLTRGHPPRAQKESKHQRTVNFIPRHLIHVNHPLLPVHLHDLPFFPFKRAPDDSHLVFFSHRNRSAVVLLLQLWRQRGGHDFTPLGRRRREVRFARFSPRRGHVRVKLHRGRSFVLVCRRFLVRVVLVSSRVRLLTVVVGNTRYTFAHFLSKPHGLCVTSYLGF